MSCNEVQAAVPGPVIERFNSEACRDTSLGTVVVTNGQWASSGPAKVLSAAAWLGEAPGQLAPHDAECGIVRGACFDPLHGEALTFIERTRALVGDEMLDIQPISVSGEPGGDGTKEPRA